MGALRVDCAYAPAALAIVSGEHVLAHPPLGQDDPRRSRGVGRRRGQQWHVDEVYVAGVPVQPHLDIAGAVGLAHEAIALRDVRRHQVREEGQSRQALRWLGGRADARVVRGEPESARRTLRPRPPGRTASTLANICRPGTTPRLRIRGRSTGHMACGTVQVWASGSDTAGRDRNGVSGSWAPGRGAGARRRRGAAPGVHQLAERPAGWGGSGARSCFVLRERSSPAKVHTPSRWTQPRWAKTRRTTSGARVTASSGRNRGRCRNPSDRLLRVFGDHLRSKNARRARCVGTAGALDA